MCWGGSHPSGGAQAKGSLEHWPTYQKSGASSIRSNCGRIAGTLARTQEKGDSAAASLATNPIDAHPACVFTMQQWRWLSPTLGISSPCRTNYARHTATSDGLGEAIEERARRDRQAFILRQLRCLAKLAWWAGGTRWGGNRTAGCSRTKSLSARWRHDLATPRHCSGRVRSSEECFYLLFAFIL